MTGAKLSGIFVSAQRLVTRAFAAQHTPSTERRRPAMRSHRLIRFGMQGSGDTEADAINPLPENVVARRDWSAPDKHALQTDDGGPAEWWDALEAQPGSLIASTFIKLTRHRGSGGGNAAHPSMRALDASH